ncbi:Ppx/GppA phosphatase family protein [Pseudovibrio exalbescens]|uniref:Ppx/GppA phosphatase family protein n=1 Tax=Pseudovibrio exalbescens TaxID=197461 RepID=UPI001AD94E75|nr:Ppx/GppA phosphatase family protein [Pseudovibrio exalbescens]
MVHVEPDGTSVHIETPPPPPEPEVARQENKNDFHKQADDKRARHGYGRGSHGVIRDREEESRRSDGTQRGRERNHRGPRSERGASPHRYPPNGLGSPQAQVNGASKELYAALDLGTNNCRLLIARPEQRGFRVVDAYSRIVRLGEGVGSSKRLSNAAMERAIEALKVCRQKLDERGVRRSRLIATEACRAADNGVDFINRARKEAGLDLEIVTQETEARLAVAGCVSLVDPEADGVLLFDIGGGSSEIVWLDLRNRYGARGFALTRFIRTWISLPLGVVNLAERHGGKNVTSDLFEAMIEDVSEKLEAFPLSSELLSAINAGNVHMLGTSGTVTTLAGVHLDLKRYDRRRVDGAWMDTDDVSAMVGKLLSMSYEERVLNPCIGEDRADLVLAGCAILEAIRRRWPCERLRVADRGLREGILMEMMAFDKVWRNNKRRGGGKEKR